MRDLSQRVLDLAHGLGAAIRRRALRDETGTGREREARRGGRARRRDQPGLRRTRLRRRRLGLRQLVAVRSCRAGRALRGWRSRSPAPARWRGARRPARAGGALRGQLRTPIVRDPFSVAAGGQAGPRCSRADAAMSAGTGHRRGRRLAGVPAHQQDVRQQRGQLSSSKSWSRRAAASRRWPSASDEVQNAPTRTASVATRARPATSSSRRWIWSATPRASPRRPWRCLARRMPERGHDA